MTKMIIKVTLNRFSLVNIGVKFNLTTLLDIYKARSSLALTLPRKLIITIYKTANIEQQTANGEESNYENSISLIHSRDFPSIPV
jgi:hypothetical protein